MPVKDLLSRIISTLPVADVALEDPGIESVIKQMGLDEPRQRVR